jgi:ABC-2 type transport system ATP-binding protein
VTVSQTAAAVLDAQDVRKVYGATVALDGASLAVRAGEIVALLGANGAGKTTLVSLVAGLRRADAGTIRVGGLDVTRHGAATRRLLGVAPQETGVYDVLTVEQNLGFFGELSGLRRRTLRTRIDELADALLLRGLLTRPAAALSGGEKRRLHTAIAMIGRPSLLLLDEPTVGADVETRAALLGVVRALADEGSAVVYSTHYLPEVDALGASVAMLVRGRVIARGRVDRLVEQYGTAVAELRFDGDAPACCVEGAGVKVDGAVLRVTATDPAVAAAAVIARLGVEDARRLRSVDLVRPSLDSVFLALTGRRYDAAGDDGVVAA